MNVKRTLGGLVAAALVLTLSACTPGVAQHWLVTEDGDVSFASCQQFTIDTLTVSTRGDVNGRDQEFQLTGPAVFFNDGESFSLDSVAAGWSDAEKLDMAAHWQDLKLEGLHDGRQTLLGYVDRADLRLGEWVQLPQSGIGVVDCERV